MTNRQPSSQQCFVCGVANPVGLQLKFNEVSPGVIESEYTAPQHFQGYPGILHGGIVATMLDETCGRAHMDGNSSRFYYTARLQIQYRKNVPIGQPLRLVGRAGEVRGRKAQATATLYNAAGDLLAEAEALLIEIPAQAMQGVDLEAMGWKVYPD